ALRSAPGKVLGHARDAVRGQRRTALEPVEIGQPQTRDQLRVLTERAVLARPARLGCEIEGGVKRRADADGEILLPSDVGELAYRLLIRQCTEAERLRPRGHMLGREGRPPVL